MTAKETPMAGGGDNYGKLRRLGDTVVRPAGPHSAAVHGFLQHLATKGFDGAPRPVGLSPTEEILTFLPGDVPVPPEPPADGWIVVPDGHAASVGALLARFHEAARTFEVPNDADWQGGFTPGLHHTAVCHNDPVVGNVVFRDGAAVALIDFDFAGPNDPLRDLAIAAQHWVPLGDPADVTELSGWSPAERFRTMCDAYGLPEAQLGGVVDLVEAYLERGCLGVRARVQTGDPRFVAYWEAGLGDRLDRALRWVRRERENLLGGAKRAGR